MGRIEGGEMKAVRMVVLVVLVSILAFALLSVSPMDPLQTNVGQTALGSMSAEQVEKLKEYWGVGVPSLPETGGGGHPGQALQFPVASGFCMDHLRHSRLPLWCACRKETGRYL